MSVTPGLTMADQSLDSGQMVLRLAITSPHFEARQRHRHHQPGRKVEWMNRAA
ncbi:hypothetical protein [Arthrobacter methylotrophus]|uniref:hypothetical protein n=1 Tax=Arthrobacter methylotrophus TaxID=121291 RepID=UPI0031ED0EF0